MTREEAKELLPYKTRKYMKKNDIIYHYQYGYGVIQTIVESTVKVLIKGNIHYFDKEDLVMCDARYIDIL